MAAALKNPGDNKKSSINTGVGEESTVQRNKGTNYAHRSIVVGRSKRQSQVGRDKRVAQDEGTKKPWVVRPGARGTFCLPCGMTRQVRERRSLGAGARTDDGNRDDWRTTVLQTETRTTGQTF